MSNMPTAKMKRRTNIGVLISSFILAGALSVNLFRISVMNTEFYQNEANKGQFGSIPISANRGTIYSSDGSILAISSTVYKVYLDPKMYRGYDDKKKELIIEYLTENLGLEEETILKKMEANNQYEVLATKVEKPEATALMTFVTENQIKSIRTEEDSKRYYPHSTLAASLIGFTNYEGNGQYGIESKYDEILAGKDGAVISAKDASGNEMPYRYSKLYEAEDGDSIYLTIDYTLQNILEKNIEEMVKTHKIANRACGIIMNAKNGRNICNVDRAEFRFEQPCGNSRGFGIFGDIRRARYELHKPVERRRSENSSCKGKRGSVEK